MAALSGTVALFLACALPSTLLSRAEGDPWGAPCEEQQRFRQNLSEPEVVWGSTVAILGGLGALMMLIQYVIHFINKDQCPQESKGSETSQEDFQESGRKRDWGRPATYGSRSLTLSPAQEEPCPSVYSQTQQAYARQLACMEMQLEALLYEVQSQRSTLKDTLMEEEMSLPNVSETGSDKLLITVYEIADCEELSNVQLKGRKRQLK